MPPRSRTLPVIQVVDSADELNSNFQYTCTFEVHEVRVKMFERSRFHKIVGLAQHFGIMVRIQGQSRLFGRYYNLILIGRRDALDRWHRVKATHHFVPPPPED